ncbi:MAG TPA: hypothetical protein VOA78_15390 [Candidatus Dormibacteraeota bacterium]|nr:hypothetical protein [Candidatus Dormibacteraeota bacterium]
MPQAPGSLSKSQILTLESCWVFFRTVRPFLQSLGNESSDGARVVLLEETARLAEMNQSRLVTHFPEVAEAAERWK